MKINVFHVLQAQNVANFRRAMKNHANLIRCKTLWRCSGFYDKIICLQNDFPYANVFENPPIKLYFRRDGQKERNAYDGSSRRS